MARRSARLASLLPPRNRFRRDGRGYLLDPWGSPYGVDHRGGRVILDSLGPNRRRESDVEWIDVQVEGALELRGDDLGLGFRVDA